MTCLLRVALWGNALEAVKDPEVLRTHAAELCSALATSGYETFLAKARRAVAELCSARLYEPVCTLAEAICRREPDPTTRRLYGQALIERGHVTVAIDLLSALAGTLDSEHPEWAEANGLLGRCYKQIYFDAQDKNDPGVLAALVRAIEIYRHPYERDPANSWHGINFIALMHRAAAAKLPVAEPFDIPKAAARLIEMLEGVLEPARDDWHAPTLAEAYFAIGDWDNAEAEIKRYVGNPARAFQVASTIRQLADVWDIETLDPKRGSAVLSVLRARLVELDGGNLKLSTAELAEERYRLGDAGIPTFEVLLGNAGAELHSWWKKGLERATGVAAVREKGGGRVGTGFLVRASDLGLMVDGDPGVVITNYHIVNEVGVDGFRPEDVEIVFEAADAEPYDVQRVVWSSPRGVHDAAILQLADVPAGVMALPLAASLPVPGPATRVYIIGHPGGRELAFSFQDNELIDHEGPPGGQPRVPGVVRLHYRAPTEGGSSGSPVFNTKRWEVIALHQGGGHDSVPKLNGKPGTYGANQGASLQSIKAAIAKGDGTELPRQA